MHDRKKKRENVVEGAVGERESERQRARGKATEVTEGRHELDRRLKDGSSTDAISSTDASRMVARQTPLARQTPQGHMQRKRAFGVMHTPEGRNWLTLSAQFRRVHTPTPTSDTKHEQAARPHYGPKAVWPHPLLLARSWPLATGCGVERVLCAMRALRVCCACCAAARLRGCAAARLRVCSARVLCALR
eukprot:6201336-Pleurochrysis_carterae.AAC.3